MKPTIGRIVIFHCDEETKNKSNNFQSDATAIITAVWGPTCVNLRVLLDGQETPWKTSCTEGTGTNQWSWPIIEKE